MDKLELPFDQYQRYKIVEELVGLIRQDRSLRVLDVGGHPGLITDFLPEDDTFVLDMLPCEGPKCIQGDGAWLPFKDASFDLVVSVDTLEHIPSEQRPEFLEELLRTSKDYVLLAAPFEDENLSLAEQIVNEFFIKRIGHPNDSLEEHFANGLPDLSEILSFFDEHRVQHLELPNGYLYNWLIMMMALPAAQTLPNSEELVAMINKFYNQNLYANDNREPCYRTVILASKQHSLDREYILSRYEGAEEVTSADTKLQLADLLLSLRLEEPPATVLKEELEKLQSEFEERTKWALKLRDEVEDKGRRIIELQNELEERTQWALRLEEESRQKGQRIIELQDELEERTKWARKLQSELDERTEWALTLENDLEKAREHLGKLQKEFEERTEWALQLRDEVQEKDQRILKLQDELEVQTQWALQLLEELEQKDEYLTRLQSEFEERTQWALQLDEELTRIKRSWVYKLLGRLVIRD